MLFEPLAGVQHRMVLNFGSDNVLPAALFRQRDGAAFDRQVVAFATAAGEDDLVGAAVQHLRAAVARIVERSPSATANGVHARRISPVFQPVLPHRLEHARIHGRRRRIVEVHGFGHGVTQDSRPVV